MGKFRSYKARPAIVHDTTPDPIEWDPDAIIDYISDDDYCRNDIVHRVREINKREEGISATDSAS